VRFFDVATHPTTIMHASALATSRPAAFLPHKQAVRQARRSSVKVMANFHSLSAKTLDGKAVLKQAAALCPSYVVTTVQLMVW
jgi:hypothetical protein